MVLYVFFIVINTKVLLLHFFPIIVSYILLLSTFHWIRLRKQISCDQLKTDIDVNN